MSDFPIPQPFNAPALSAMHRTEKRLDLLNEKMEQMLKLLAKIEENTRKG